ncbi:hypothetical protein ASPZODRAFT_129054 [Penicilliopsis zonata CBS 506.65]|uniref:ASST-domain-containing protein n=1 Tax=Penicilliopsis zonata CBS 506.65 TaxID=1073090 RepID=A0A1L9STH6_9EURO|nr:hypothetical protein ASPZODRAFT_129054 [Penicilliopsis zonata CBS 506.65]OJJ50424.1 hypothetical protein ASPZODRAFT_129054 [Penicilliopsis zonata CBS 506.65]
MAFWAIFLLLAVAVSTVAARETFDDEDFTSYVTLPKNKILKWKVTYHDREAVAPGYWFVAPYYVNGNEPHTGRWMPCQIGAHIFDQDGELVWAGSCLHDNENIFDFRMSDAMDPEHQHLTMIVEMPWAHESDLGTAVIYNDRYEETTRMKVFNTHEFWPYSSTRAMAVAHRNERRSLAELGQPDRSWQIQTGGFDEMDLTTGEVLWEWNSRDVITLDESFVADPIERCPMSPGADYLHVNAIDRNERGDFLLSARHTDGIYFISGEDHQLKWRLGGKKSDFKLVDFTFSRQHHARFHEVNDTHMVVSMLNNGADMVSTQERTSSGLYVLLDLQAMEARLLRRYLRPDGGSTQLRGNMQTLPNKNVLMGWSKNGYMSEFTHDGRLLMEAEFASDRFSTYRTYKFPWVGKPSTPPTLMASVHGTNDSDLSTVFHVSWNGATEVRHWRFRAQASEQAAPVELDTVAKTGFETVYISHGYMDWVSVEALDADQNSLGTSEIIRSSAPEYWPEDAALPTADDPSTINNSTAYAHPHRTAGSTSSTVSLGIFLLGVLSTLAAMFLLRSCTRLRPWFRRAGGRGYSAVNSDEQEDIDLTKGASV